MLLKFIPWYYLKAPSLDSKNDLAIESLDSHTLITVKFLIYNFHSHASSRTHDNLFSGL